MPISPVVGGGSVQRRLSTAVARSGWACTVGATDKHYSFGSSNMRAFLSTVVTALALAPLSMAHAQGSWQEYAVPEYGFSVALPSAPQSRPVPVPSSDGSLRVYEALDPNRKLSKFSVFVGMPEHRGIFETASMDAFLSGHIASMVRTAENGKLISSQRIPFRGQPALEYEFKHDVAGVPYVARGVTFMVDGGHMRISMWHPVEDSNSKAAYERFASSFQLKPIAFRPANPPFQERGVKFSPPTGWIKRPVQNAVQIARYGNLTRSLQVLLAENPAYTCDTLRGELQATGRLKEVSQVSLAGRPFAKFVSFEDVPKYNVRLTTAQYCFNSRRGAAVLVGSEEEAMFWRWAEVLEGAAATLVVQ